MPNLRRLTLALFVLSWSLCAGAAVAAERGQRSPHGSAFSLATRSDSADSGLQESHELARLQRLTEERLRLMVRLALLLGLNLPEPSEQPIYTHVIDGPDPIGNSGDGQGTGQHSGDGTTGNGSPLGGGTTGPPPDEGGDPL